MSACGDLHNFAQAVRRIKAPNGHEFFEKPRTLFWERLFFGVDSPLKQVLPPDFHFLFGLEIETLDHSVGGRSKLIPSAEALSTTPENLFQFGCLLGYAYAFGLQDLHRQNVVKTINGLQIVDAEVVLTRFTLPHESLLLPFRETTFEKAALSHLVAAPIISVNEVTTILDGFTEILSVLAAHANVLARLVTAEIGNKPIPIRVLLRDTFRYRNWRSVSYEIPLLPEEITQLERGDIPYFFKFPAGRDLFYYTTPTLEFEKVTPPEAWSAGVDAIGVPVTELLSTQRITETLIPSGALFLLRKLLAPDWTGDVTRRHYTARVYPEKLEIQIADRSYSSTRQRSVGTALR